MSFLLSGAHAISTPHESEDAHGFLARIIHQPQKPTEEGALESRMMLKTAVSQERHNPKTNASGCPGTVPIGLMVVIGHNASSQPPQAYSTLLAPAPSMDALDRASQGLLG